MIGVPGFPGVHGVPVSELGFFFSNLIIKRLSVWISDWSLKSSLTGVDYMT